jgi:hypothetical protein
VFGFDEKDKVREVFMFQQSEFTVNKQLISSNLLCEALILKVLKEINLYTKI